MTIQFRLFYIYFVVFFKQQTFCVHLEFYVGAQKKLYKNPFTLFFHLSNFFIMNQRTDFDASSQTYFKNSNNGIELYGV